jgi:2-methylisocitrate lyase-like PEP mutase family enzyme
LPELLGFYELAATRDDALVANALAKLRATGEPLAALITGGFHGPRITAQLAAAGYPVVSVAPKITTPTNEQLYQAVLNYKHGHGTLAEVEAQVALPSAGR